LFAILNSFFALETGFAGAPDAAAIRLLLPPIVLLTISLQRTTKRLTVIACSTTVFISFILSFTALFSTLFDISAILLPFVKTDNLASVWEQSNSIGRITGIFNQPLEAGTFYSIALLALIYLSERKVYSRQSSIIMFIAIMMGGFLSLSKVFIVMGLLTALVYSIMVRVVAKRTAITMIILSIIIVPPILGYFNELYVNSLVDIYKEHGLLSALTAGRVGAKDTSSEVLLSRLIVSNQWFNGAGLASYSPLDNGYLEYFYQGGFFSLLGYLAFLVNGVLLSLRSFVSKEGKLLLCIFFFILGSSIGGPVITANRANVPLMVIVTSCMMNLSVKKEILIDSELNRSK
jgi:hypothetical protein